MKYPSFIGARYIRSKKKQTISAISAIAIAGVALGVAALATVISISSGFQDEFTRKVLGVNAHVLVMKYGMDFQEYRDVMDMVQQVEGVKSVEPFVIQEMMMAKDDHTAGVLLKGIDPQRVAGVLDLSKYIVDGGIDALRTPGTRPPPHPRDRVRGLASPDRLRIADTNDTNVSAAPANAVTDDDTAADTNDDANPSAPETPSSDALPGIVIGKTLAETLNAQVGDEVQIITPLIGLSVLGWSPSEDTPKFMRFRVTGIFYAGFHEYDSKLVFVDYFRAQRFFEHGDSVTGIELTVHDIHKAAAIADTIRDALKDGPYHTIHWEKLNESLFTALKTQKLVLTVVLAIIVGLASFNIIATLVMMVFDKRKEIAILKSMGATHGGVLRIFVHVGTMVGIYGIALGLAIGFAICFALYHIGWPLDPEVYLIDHLPVTLDWRDFVATAGVAFFICIAATIFPSLHASRMRPVDGLRQA